MSDQRVDSRIRDMPPDAMQQPSTLPNEPYYQQPAAGNRNARRTFGVILVLIGVLWFAFSSSQLPRFGQFGIGGSPIVDETFAARHVDIRVGNGDVTIRPSDTQGIHVTATQQGGLWTMYAVDATQSGDTVQVTQAAKNSVGWFGQPHMRYEIQVPSNATASVQTTSGAVTAEGDIGAVTLATANGDVDVRDLANGATIVTEHGDVQIRDARGTLDVKSTSGDIDLNNVSGTLHLQSSGGDIAVRDGHDVQVTASTTNGDIEYDGDLALAGTNSITTSSGDVDVQLPRGNNLAIQTKTRSGDVDNDRASRNSSGATTLSVETGSGDIDIK